SILQSNEAFSGFSRQAVSEIARENKSPSCLTLSSSAREPGALPRASSALFVASGSEISRRLLTSVFLFCAKHVFTNSKNFSSFEICVSDFAPGSRKLTRAEPTSGGGRNAPRGIFSAIAGFEKYWVSTER